MAGQQARQEPQTIHAGGEWRAAVSGATREILDPADARPFAVVAEGDEKDTDLAVAAARQAFDSGQGPWPLTPVAERAALLRRVADLLVRDREELGLLESRDAGKTVEEGRVDIDCVADAFRYFADLVAGEAPATRSAK
jgi:betaine-aldehyde dehydrogenase